MTDIITRKQAQDRARSALNRAEDYAASGSSGLSRAETYAAIGLGWATLAGTLPQTNEVAGRDRTLREATSR